MIKPESKPINLINFYNTKKEERTGNDYKDNVN